MAKLFLTNPIHPLQLRVAVGAVDDALEKFYAEAETVPLEHIAHKLEEVVSHVGLQAAMAGREYATTAVSAHGMVKTAWVPTDWSWEDDAKKIISHLKLKPKKYMMDAIHNALMTGEGPPVEELARTLGYDQGRAVARTVVMNIYAKAALKKWDEDGIEHVKRIETEDNKTCPICRAINGKEYRVSDLLQMPNPQSHDTHENCRGSFLPLINISTYAPKARPLPDLKITSKHNTAENVPVELYTMLKQIMNGGKLPFDLRFDNKIKADYKRDGKVLVVNPKALSDEDIRDIIYEEQAEQMWPEVEERVNEEYIPLLQHGFAKTSRSWDTPKEAFINNWIAFKMGQAPFNTDIWGQAFMRSISR